MTAKLELNKKVVSLRKRGYSYSEILKEVQVSKSSLSLWLKNVSLSKIQSNKLYTRIVAGQMLGAMASRYKRLSISKQIRKDAMDEIHAITKKEMLMLGAMLYWGEGSKQTDRNISQPVEFVNSDPNMCKFFIKWITEILEISIKDVVFRVYINESKRNKSSEYKNIWSKVVNVPTSDINLYFTKDRHSNLRRTERDSYKGQLKIIVNKSTNLNRRIAGLIEGICLHSGIIN